MKNTLNPNLIFADFFTNKITKGLAYELSSKLQDGNICLPLTYFENSDNLNENPFYKDAISFDLSKTLKDPQIGKLNDITTPFIYHKKKFYIQRYFSYETEIITLIRNLIENENVNTTIEKLKEHQIFINSLFTNYKTDAVLEEENIQWQCIATISSVLHNFSVITGGPGTGKTTTVAKILAILYTLYPNCKVALAAPTGKAAARMKESLLDAKKKLTVSDTIKNLFESIDSGTIHRLLGYIRDSHYFKHNATNPLPYDVLIIDESSMIGTTLIAKLLSAITTKTKIIFLGDKNQLASVEAGSIFGDICLTQKESVFSSERASFINNFIIDDKAKLNNKYIKKHIDDNILKEHIVELKRSYRFKGEEAIGVFSKAIIEENLTEEILAQCDTDEKQYVKIVTHNATSKIEKLYSLYEDYIQEKDISKAIQKLNRVKILCAVKKGDCGIDYYNNAIAGYLQEKGLINVNPRGFYENQPILITQNNKILNLFNGDIGIVRKNSNGRQCAYFEGRIGVVEIACNRIENYQTVFAMTIHKSQGSEFQSVGLVLPNHEDLKLLTRELIYTGVTRAKQNVLIIGEAKVLKKGISRQVKRASGITDRLTTNL